MRRRWIALFAALAIGTTACGSDDDESSATAPAADRTGWPVQTVPAASVSIPPAASTAGTTAATTAETTSAEATTAAGTEAPVEQEAADTIAGDATAETTSPV